MIRIDPPLAFALMLSLLAHLLPLAVDLPTHPRQEPPPPLQAELRPSATPPLATPPLLLDEPAPPPPAFEPPHAKPAAARGWQREIRRQFRQQQQRGDFYPAEAIARGLQGEVLVLFLLAPDGRVTAARVEQGSGHAVLDDAALRAVRALHSLPADAPREALIPVRFRLH